MNKYTCSIFFCLILLPTMLFAQLSGSAIAPERVPSNANVEILVETTAKFVSVKARRSLFESVKVVEISENLRSMVLNATDLAELQKLVAETPRKFVFTGVDGKYLVEIMMFDTQLGIFSEELVVEIGDSPSPDPGPGPQPPKPDPKPPVDTISSKIKTAFEQVPASSREKSVSIRMPDGNLVQKELKGAVAGVYSDIGSDAKSRPEIWDVPTMVDTSRVDISAFMPVEDIRAWKPFFDGLTALQVDLDSDDVVGWADFFVKVATVLTEN